MTIAALSCPCPCQIVKDIPSQEQWTVKMPDFWLEPGDRISSPGGKFQYEVLSYPFCQLFLDFKGEFEGISWMKLLNEAWECEEERAIAISFLAFFRNGGKTYPPTYQRMIHQVLFFVWWKLIRCELLPASALPIALSMTGRLLPHKDNLALVQDERGKWKERAVFPATYLHQVVGFEQVRTKRSTFTPYYQFSSVVRASR